MPLFGLKKRPKAPAELIEQPVVREFPTPADEPKFVEIVDSEQLLQLLFDAISASDHERLSALCDTHRDTIGEHVDMWRIVPDALRTNPAAAEWYVQGIERLTRFCADERARN
jgi:hypothetical protein